MTWKPACGRSLVVVHWNDAFASGATQAYTADDVPHGLCPMATVGLVLKDDPMGVSIACETYYNDTDQQHEFRGHTFIPRAMIISVDVLIDGRGKKVRRPKSLAAVEPSLDLHTEQV